MTINLSHSKEITKVPSAMRATPRGSGRF